MIKVLHYQNESVDKSFVAKIDTYYDELRQLLPSLPETLQVYFSDYGIMIETGVGGFAYSDEIVTISIEADFPDKAVQLSNIRPTIFHEGLHLYQKYTGDHEYSAIESAVYEGMATVFEREVEGTLQPYGIYKDIPIPHLKEWFGLLSDLGEEYIKDEKVRRKWAFYNDDLQERWILYKTGTWITDEVLIKTGLNILDLKDKTAKEILLLYQK